MTANKGSWRPMSKPAGQRQTDKPSFPETRAKPAGDRELVESIEAVFQHVEQAQPLAVEQTLASPGKS